MKTIARYCLDLAARNCIIEEIPPTRVPPSYTLTLIHPLPFVVLVFDGILFFTSNQGSLPIKFLLRGKDVSGYA